MEKFFNSNYGLAFDHLCLSLVVLSALTLEQNWFTGFLVLLIVNLAMFRYAWPTLNNEKASVAIIRAWNWVKEFAFRLLD